MQPVDKAQLKEGVEAASSGILTLCSGNSLFFEEIGFHGEIKSPSALQDDIRGQTDVKCELDLEDSVIIRNRETSPEHWVVIPQNKIYNIIPIQMPDGAHPTGLRHEYPQKPTFLTYTFEYTARTALQSDICHFEPMVTAEAIDIGDMELSWGPVEFNQSTPVYSDWTYFEKSRSSLSGVGAGAFGFSLSASWDENLRNRFAESLQSNRCGYEEIHSKSEATVCGQVDFIYRGSHALTEEIEGEKWRLGLISEEEVQSASEIQDVNHVFGLFKEDAFLYPPESWQHIQDDLHIFGQPFRVEIQLGSMDIQNCLKVRSAGYID